MRERSVNQGNLSLTNRLRSIQRRPRSAILLLLSIVLHAIGIVYLLTKLPVKVESPPAGNLGTVSINLTPSPSNPPKRRTIAPSAKPKPRKAAPSPAQISKPIVTVAPQPATTSAAQPQPETPKYQQSVQEDFSSHIQATRERREAVQANERAMLGDSAATEDAPQSPNDIARANIQAQRGWMGVDQGKTGGIFEVRDQTPFSAKLLFRGWNPDGNRNSTQLIPVERGSENSIEIAIVNKMIELIRNKTNGDIPWRSQRLGRVITLSARLKDTVELQQFLMQEMFFQYTAPARR